MKRKSKFLILILFVCFIISVCLLKWYDNEKKAECRYCTLRKLNINGEIEDVILKVNNPINAKNLVWSVSVEKEATSTKQISVKDDFSIDKCLSRLFKNVKYSVHVEDSDIVEFDNNCFKPKKEGATTARIQILVDMDENLLCGPPPSFEDEINLRVE